MKCSGLFDDTVSIIIGGQAGQGISRSGQLLGKALMRGGFYAYGDIDYPSLIKGGHNFYQIRASSRKIHSVSPHVDLIIALNKETILLHIDTLNENGGIIHDSGLEITSEELGRPDITLFPVPLTEVVTDLKGPSIMRNTVALGSAAALIGFDPEKLKEIVSETFKGKDRIIAMNHEAIQKGWEYVNEFDYEFQCVIEEGERPERIWLSGNEAVALGAIQAGCKFYAAYPMTPASPVLHYLIANEEDTGMVVVQTESEIAAICMTVGASYTGVRAMTSTSGGGFCLMIEGISLAAMIETPIVVMLGQRPGPSTGLATYSAQGDLLFAVYGVHGEFQRIVITPGDVEECYYLTAEAFNLAERFQIPVIIVTDKNLIEGNETIDPFDTSLVKINRGRLVENWEKDEKYLRYKITEDGVSPRAIPSTMNAIKLANSNEHTEYGFSTSLIEPTKNMVDKRFRKIPDIKNAVQGLKPIKVYGDPEANITLLGWGSVKGPALEALKLLKEENIATRFVQIRFVEPFPEDMINYLEGTVILFENNRTAQLGKLIKHNTGTSIQHVELRYDGRAFDPYEIRDKVLEVISC